MTLAASSALNPKAVEFKPAAMKLNPNATPFGGAVKKRIPTPPAATIAATTTPQHTTIAGKAVEHKVFVSTPWYSKGIDKSAVQLSGEIEAFHEFVKLDQTEARDRSDTCDVIQSMTKLKWPQSTMVRYGSFAVGTSAPNSAVDVMIDNCNVELASVDVREAFKPLGVIRSLMCNGGTAFAQIESPAGVLVNISLHKEHGSDAARKSVAICNHWISQFPSIIKPVLSVLRQIMTQTGNLEVSTGGLSAYALLIMIIYVTKTFRPMSCGSLLLQFCRFYGKDFNFNDFSVDLTLGAVAKVHQMELISIVDPSEKTGNIASGCTRAFQVQVQLQHCYSALLRWETRDAGDNRGYKGRTPLSGVISHQKLWARSEYLQEIEKKVAKAAASTPKSKFTLEEIDALMSEKNESLSYFDIFGDCCTSNGLSESPSSLSFGVGFGTNSQQPGAAWSSAGSNDSFDSVHESEELLRSIDQAIANDLMFDV